MSEIVVGITSNIQALRDQNAELPTFRDRATAQADKLEVPGAAMDNLAITEFNEIIGIQNHIIAAGGAVGLGSTCYSDSTALITTRYGDLVTGIGTTTGDKTAITGIGSTQTVAFGTLSLDVLEAHRMPKVESGTLDTSTDNPFIGEGFVTLTTGNAGIGNSTRLNRGAGAGSTVFALVNPCNNVSGIATLRTAYDNLVTGIATFISAATLVKEEKNQNRLIAWSLGRKIASNTAGITSAESVIDTLEDPGLGGPF